jgi:uncharacterized protein (DUF4415 family)
MEIEFDPEKAADNPLQHDGVTFAEAKDVLLDPNALTREDTDSDSLFKQYADMDFTDAKPVAKVPALARLQALQGGKSRITMRVDTATLAAFKARAEMTGGNYQTLINEALRQFAQGQTLAEVVRETIRQELSHV